MKKRKVLYLHIGTHKTGTTSLQCLLHDNMETLRNYGFNYPSSGRGSASLDRYGHHRLASVLNRGGQIDNSPPWNDLLRELSESSFRNVIISSENFEWLKNPSVLKRAFKDHLVRPIIYLRRQDDYLESFYQQQIRDFKPNVLCDFQTYVGTQDKLNFLNYKALIQRWSTAFGKRSVIVRNYDEMIMNGTDTKCDFFSLLDIPAEKLESAKRDISSKNRSSIQELDYLRAAKSISSSQNEYARWAKRITKLELGSGNDGRLMDHDDRVALLHRFEKSNEWVRSRYFRKGKKRSLFSSPDYSRKDIQSNYTEDDLIELLK